LIVRAKVRGIPTTNAARRSDVTAESRDLACDVVLVDCPAPAERARDAAGGAPTQVGIDAYRGSLPAIPDSVGDGAVVVNYGSTQGKDLEIGGAALGFSRHHSDGFQILAPASPSAPRARFVRSTPITAARWCVEGTGQGLLPDRGARVRAARRARRQRDDKVLVPLDGPP
jgi:hypothetical protein